ncbi:Hsp20 family protein [Pseudaminobacter sp. 19-2017]|uniref:Hsp20 family protein n=1 Tax=Pseudaminobacter soli (ex Zhang et al. 2022) TaxID=2831468 RepID=A0A942E218_9HYPH|nr:Hsp20 family protein [Pseudaminobacter soli]MBS3652349.1 Hsp20 family protein [Pseudaminobacter soli]
MRTTFDFTPLFRSSVGFDRVFDMLENASRVSTIDSWPPYDITKAGEDEYRISLAVAGFSESEVSVTHEPNILVIAGQKADDEQGEYLHRGIAGRGFQRRFELADFVKVVGANLVNGMLTIDLKREIPEEMKPRRIQIASGSPSPMIEATKAKGEQKAA